jgi:hypothetical protein
MSVVNEIFGMLAERLRERQHREILPSFARLAHLRSPASFTVPDLPDVFHHKSAEETDADEKERFQIAEQKPFLPYLRSLGARCG